jgi:hypothetical protein
MFLGGNIFSEVLHDAMRFEIRAGKSAARVREAGAKDVYERKDIGIAAKGKSV